MRPQPHLRARLGVLLVCAMLVAALLPAVVRAQAAVEAASAAIAPEADATVSSLTPKENFGDDLALRVAHTPASEGAAATTDGALLQFNLGGLPPGTLIVSAQLLLYQTGAATESGAQVIYAANSAWQEKAVTWNNGPGKPAGPAPVSFSTPPLAGDWVSVDVTPFVQAWAGDRPQLPNKGFVILPEPAAADTPVERVYASRESEQPPQLKVEYQLPPIRVCNGAADPCEGAPGAEVYNLDTGRRYVADATGTITTSTSIALGDHLWAVAKVEEGNQSALYHTMGEPAQVAPEAFAGGTGMLPLVVSAQHPLHLQDLEVSAQWNVTGAPALQERLRAQFTDASRYLYAFTDGQFALGKITIRSNAEGWEDADLRLYAQNALRPKAVIGGSVLTATADISPTLAITYYPGPISMGWHWNRYGTPPNEVIMVGGVEVPPEVMRDDWALALAHELGHWLLFLFDTYSSVDGMADFTLAEQCSGSAMGDVYNENNHGFIFDLPHWIANCVGTEAYTRLNGRTEWDTIAAWHPQVVRPQALVAGPEPAVTYTQVEFVPPGAQSGAYAGGEYEIEYQAGATASAAVRAILFAGERLIDMGKPSSGTPARLDVVGAQAGDRLCVYDIMGAAYTADPRHQFGCRILSADGRTLIMTMNPAWEPEIAVWQTGPQQVRIDVTQTVAGPDIPLRVRLYPENGTLLQEITLPYGDGFYRSLSVDLGVPVPPLFVQLYVDETPPAPFTRREIVADRGVGGGGAFGPARLRGGAPVQSSDGSALFETSTPLELGVGDSIAWQSMAAAPTLPAEARIVGRSYRLDAYPPALGEGGMVRLAFSTKPDSRVLADAAKADRVELENAAIYFFDGEVWEKLPTSFTTPAGGIEGSEVAAAASRGPGVYAVLLGAPDAPDVPAATNTYLPMIEALP